MSKPQLIKQTADRYVLNDDGVTVALIRRIGDSDLFKGIWLNADGRPDGDTFKKPGDIITYYKEWHSELI